MGTGAILYRWFDLGSQRKSGGIGNRIGLLENERNVGMGDKAITAGKALKAAFRQYFGGEMLRQRSIGTAMDKRAFTNLETLGQIDQKLTMLLGELLGCPFSRDAGCRAKIFQVNFGDSGPIMVASNDDI